MSAPPIHTDGLAKTYGGARPVHALHPLSLTVAPGEVFGLVGPNGAGKTTLVKLLLGIVRPTAGTATLFDVPVGEAAARQPVGYLPEGHRFPPFLTGRQALDVLARMAGVSAADRAGRSPGLLDRVGLGTAADRAVGTYSKGMMQRLGIAQALMNRPRLVLLDEPTDGVDPVGRREIREIVSDLAADGVTVLLNSHLLSEIERVCTRVAILDRGRLVRDGTVGSLTAVGRAWTLTTTALSPDALAALGPHYASAPPDPAVPGLSVGTLTAPDRAALNAALDALRAAGVEIERVDPVRQSLEDLFVTTVSPEDAR